MIGQSLIKTVEDHQGLAAWVQALFSVIAIISATAVAYWLARSDRREHERVAMMQVTIHIDTWIDAIVEAVQEDRLYSETNESDGALIFCLPPHPFVNFEIIAKLPPKFGQDVFELVESAGKSDARIRSVRRFSSDDNANRVAMEEAVALYKKLIAERTALVRSLAWQREKVFPWQIATMEWAREELVQRESSDTTIPG